MRFWRALFTKKQSKNDWVSQRGTQVKDLFLTAEYNYINLPRLDRNYKTVDRIFLDRLLLGAGYSQPLGGNTKLNVMAMYDVLFQRPSPFLTPWVFRVFFTF